MRSFNGEIILPRAVYQHHVQRQTHRVALNLDVALLHDVEETNLNLAGKIWQLVDRKDPAIRARQQPIVNRQLVAQEVSALGGFDRIDVADDVGDSHVRCRKFLNKARVATNPIDVRHVAVQLYCLAAVSRNGMKGVVVDFRAGNNRDRFIKQLC